MDLSFLTDEELAAVERGDLSSLSDESLAKLEGNPDMAEEMASPVPGNEGIPKEFLMEAQEAFDSGDGKRLDRVKKAIEIWKETNVPATQTEAQLKEKNKQGTAEDVKNALGLLKDIETYPNAMSVPAWGIQNLGEMMGLNQDLSTYNQKRKMLGVPIMKGIMSDTGQVSDYAQKTAEAYLPTGKQLFSKEGRSKALDNLFDSIQANTGRDLKSEMKPEELEAIGYLGSMLKKNSVAPKDKARKLSPRLTPEEQRELEALEAEYGK